METELLNQLKTGGPSANLEFGEVASQYMAQSMSTLLFDHWSRLSPQPKGKQLVEWIDNEIRTQRQQLENDRILREMHSQKPQSHKVLQLRDHPARGGGQGAGAGGGRGAGAGRGRGGGRGPKLNQEVKAGNAIGDRCPWCRGLIGQAHGPFGCRELKEQAQADANKVINQTTLHYCSPLLSPNLSCSPS